MSTLLQTLPATLPASPAPVISAGASAAAGWQAFAMMAARWGGAAIFFALLARRAGVLQMRFAIHAGPADVAPPAGPSTLDYERSDEPTRTAWFRPAPVMTAPLWLGFGVLVGMYVLVPAIASEPLTRLLFGTGDFAGLALLTATYASGLLALYGVQAALGWPARDAIGLRRPIAPRLAIAAVFATLIVVPLTNAATMLTQLAYHALRVNRESTHALLKLMDRNEHAPLVLSLSILNASLLAPLYEELLFRGHLQTALRGITPRGSPWPAILMTSLLFASIHQPATIIPPIFVLSCAIGYAYERTGSLWVALAVHASFNTLSTGLFLLFARG